MITCVWLVRLVGHVILTNLVLLMILACGSRVSIDRGIVFEGGWMLNVSLANFMRIETRLILISSDRRS